MSAAFYVRMLLAMREVVGSDVMKALSRLLMTAAVVLVGGLNGVAYQQCGSVWYQPQISGSSTTYIVVNAPR